MLTSGGGAGLITVSMSATVGAERGRVWQALISPDEVAKWSPGWMASVDVPEDYPRPGQHARWRYRMGKLPITLHDRPLEVIPDSRLHTKLVFGLFRFDATITLVSDGSDPARTVMGIKLVTPNVVPLVGGVLDRFAVRTLASQIVDRSLRGIRAHCEGQICRSSPTHRSGLSNRSRVSGARSTPS